MSRRQRRARQNRRSRHIRPTLCASIAALLAAVGALAFASPALAFTWNVDSTADNPDANPGDTFCDDGTGHCTLRAAVEEVGATGDASSKDTINLPAGNYELTHTITGNGSGTLFWDDRPDLEDHENPFPTTLEIVGAGSATTTIEQTFNFSVFEAADDLELRELAVEGGGGNASVGDGGGISTDSFIVLDHVVVTNNHASHGTGGGIFATGGGRIQDSTIAGNSASTNGGGISTFTGSAGGIGPRGSLRIERSLIGDTTVGRGNGAGIYFNDPAENTNLTVEESTISGNTGAERGGGIYFDSEDGLLSLLRSTVSGNRADDEDGDFREGGGLRTYGHLLARNSTISGNTVASGGTSSRGGGMWVATGGSLVGNLRYVTVASNLADDGSALFTVGGATPGGGTRLMATIVSGSCSPSPGPPVISDGYNVETGATCGLTEPTDKQNTNPGLGPLSANGGPTATHAILFNGPAHDIQPEEGTICGSALRGAHRDQRGEPRPFGNACDAGAFELRPQDIPVPASSPPAIPSAAPPAIPSNAFQLGKVKRNKKKGIAFLIVNVPGPGQVGLSGKGVKNVVIASASAQKSVFTPGGLVKLRVKPGKGKRARNVVRALKRKGKAKLKVLVTYVPTGGVASTQARKLKLVKK